MIRVLHLVRSLNVGGLEQVVVDLVNGLGAQGVECHVGCLVEEGEWIGRIRPAGRWVGGVGRKSRLAVVLDFVRYLKRNRIQLIHSHNAQAHIFGVAASILTGIPLIHTKHGRNFPDIPRWVWLSRQLSRFTRKIVAVSDQVARIAIDVERVPAGKVTVIPNGVDTERFRPRRKDEVGPPKADPPAAENLKPERGKEGPTNIEYRTSNIQCPGGEEEKENAGEKNQQNVSFCNSGFRFQPSALVFDERPAEVESAYTDKAVPNLLGVRYPEATGRAAASARQPLTVEAFRSSLLPGTFVVGTVGRIVPEKNYPLLVQAFAEFHAGAPRSRLLIVGDGPNAADVERAIEELGIRDACTITGMQGDTLPWLRLMDVFCLSSWTEGTSVTLLEACACGLAAVVTDVGSNARIVADKQTGLVVAPGRREPLADAFAKLHGNPGMKAGMGEAARQRICSTYSNVRLVEEYLRTYGECVS